MINLNGITTLIFDFGGVLIDLDREASVAKFEALGVHHADQLLNNYVQAGIFLDLEKGILSAPMFREEVCKMAGKDIPDQLIDEALYAFLLTIPNEKLELLLRLKSKYRMLLLSNTNPIHFEWAKKHAFSYDRHTIDDYFHHCYLSYQMHCAKPDALIFEKLLKHANVAAEECLLLDDGKQNCDTAAHLGIKTYLVQPKEDLQPLFE